MYNKLFAEIYFGINRDAWYSKMNTSILEVHLDYFYAAKKCVKPRNIESGAVLGINVS